MIVLSQRREVGEFRKRYKWMALVVLVSFAILFGRLIQLQILAHDKWDAIARENITKTIGLPATRGLLRDTNGTIIASNRPSYVVYITPQLLAPGDEQRIAELMRLDEEAKKSFLDELASIPLRRRTHQIRMFEDITRDQMAALTTHALELPAVDVNAEPVRTYPFGRLGAHALGYMNEVTAEDLERLEGQNYRAGNHIGRTGIEKAWESYLRGRGGFRRILVNARGQRQIDREGLVPFQETIDEPTPGQDVTLSLDMELMRIIDRAFRGQPSGAAVVVETNTGKVRALYSKPVYDLNDLTAGLSYADFQELLDDPFRPLIDKTIFESYFPGSTFKPITAMAALQAHITEPSQRVECPGYYEIGPQRMRCTGAHGNVDLHAAIVQSCNVYFWKIAEGVGLSLLNRYAREFGLGTRTGIGINSESNGFLANRAWYEKHFGRFRIGYTLNTAIGQGNTRATLLQLGMAYAAIANRGTLYAPLLVESIARPDGTEIETFPSRIRRSVEVDPEHLATTVAGMRGVVNEPNGTAYEAHIPHGVLIAGKTGTAEVARSSRRHPDPRRAWYFNRSHAWFGGFAPADDPQVAIIILVEHGGAGGKTAAPIGIQILQEYLGARQARLASATEEAPPAAEGHR